MNNYADYMEYYNEAAYNVDPTAMPVYSERKIAEWRVHPMSLIYIQTQIGR